MTRNFPGLLAGSTPELSVPAFNPHGGASRTLTAVLTADAGWRRLLDDDHLSLLTHLGSLRKLADHFCHLDDSLAAVLDRTIQGHPW